MFSHSLRSFHSLLVPVFVSSLILLQGNSSPNQPPVAANDSIQVHGGTQLNIMANDSDPDFNDSISFDRIGDYPQHGGFYGPNSSSPFYIPNSGYVGSDTFTYRIQDSTGAFSSFATVTLDVRNTAPAPGSHSYTVHGLTLFGTLNELMASDTDPDGDSISFDSIQAYPQHGSLTNQFLQYPGYTPNLGYTGPDSFTYKICDNLGRCAVATVTLDVVNRAPTAGPDSFTVHGFTAFGANDLLANDGDPDGDLLSFDSVQTYPQHGVLSIPFGNAPQGYTPDQGFAGTDSFVYRVCDNLGLCSAATVNLNVMGEPTPTPTPTPMPTATPTPPPPPPTPSPTPTPTPTEPLIFIPGISGSRLDERLNSGGRKNLWPGFSSLVPLIVSDKSRLTLDPTQAQANIFAPDIIRSVPARVLGMTVTEQDVYGTLIQRLAQNGYREYLINNDPSRRTAAGCDLSQRSDDPNTNPNLFVFAYDWRQSNAEGALALKSYVECVKRFYPDSKVNLLTHSMGGLLARRYIVDNPSGAHNVDKLITIAAPWLGAPKAMNVLETGDFGVPEMIVKDDTLKALVKFFKSAHEILPSRFYLSLGGDVFGEKNWDINGDRRSNQVYSYDQLVALVDNVRFRESKPGSANRAFHTAAQDDWRDDNSGVKYFHFYGNQRRAETIGKLTAVSRPLCDATGVRCKPINELVKTFVRGDGTVPVLSADRNGNGINLNAPNALVRAFTGPTDDVEHTALTQNAQVFAAIQSALVSDSQSQARNAVAQNQTLAHHRLRPSKPFVWGDTGQSVEPADPARYLSVWGVDYIVIEDALGNRNDPIPGTPFGERLPEVSYDLGLNSVSVITPSDQSYTLTFRSKGEPIFVEVVTGVGNEIPTQAIRYIDLNLPSGTMAELRLTPSGVEDLRYDNNGDGIFESTVSPTASLVGDSAGDIEAPIIALSEELHGNDRGITFNAVDHNSGVRDVRYSLDGQTFQRYSAPFAVNACERHTVYAFADDNAGNRSELFTFELPNLPPDLSGARPSLTTLWPPNHKLVAISILGITDPDCDPVTITITQITQDEPSNGAGDGDTCPDAEGIGTPIAKLRAERDGRGNGRVYTVYFTATDSTGKASAGTVKVVVPKDRNKDALRDDQQFDSTWCP